MDTTTLAVRAMYEQFPYPAHPHPQIRVGCDVRLALSYARLPAPERTLRVLDAGCGRGAGLLGMASVQPDVQFIGADMNRVGLEEVRGQIAARGMKNVALQEIDLMTLEGLEVPEGGFDLIVSSGVLHHLSDPAEGLRRLRAVLAPHGILTIMVYGQHGREGIYRLVRAVDALIPRDRPLLERLAVARRLVREGPMPGITDGPWKDIDGLATEEFVDRYLNVNERAYTTDEIHDLLGENELCLLEFCERADWSLPPGSVAAALPARERHRIIDNLNWRPRLSFYATHAANGPRPPVPPDAWARQVAAVHPECSFQISVRNLHRSQRVETIHYQVRLRERVRAPPGPLADALMIIKDQNTPFPLANLISHLRSKGAEPLEVIGKLLAEEVIYLP